MVVLVVVASVSSGGVVSGDDSVVGWGGGVGGDATVDLASKAGSGSTRSRPRELGGGSGVAMPDVGQAVAMLVKAGRGEEKPRARALQCCGRDDK